ncbi:cohesin domain-containing protein [Natrialbaceae archaeon A-arb3/5]
MPDAASGRSPAPPDRPQSAGERDETDRTGRSIGIGLAVVVLCGLLVGGATGVAVAGDQVAIISVDPGTVEASPGETVEFDVALRSDGGHGDEGIEAVTIVAQYHPDHVSVDAVEHGPWLEAGEETEIRTASGTAHEDGTAIQEQWREPVAGGATGTGTVATVTATVDEDAPTGETAIAFDESEVDLESDWPMPVVADEATVQINGSEDELASFDHPGPDEVELDEDVMADRGESASDDDTDPVAVVPFGLGAAVVLVAVAGFGLLRHRYRHSK